MAISFINFAEVTSAVGFTSLSSGTFGGSNTSQAGDVIFVAGMLFSTAPTSPAIKSNNNDAGIFGTLNGTTTPIFDGGFNGDYMYCGVIPNPTVGSTGVTFSASNTIAGGSICAWLVRGFISTPIQEIGLFTGTASNPTLSGLTGILAAANEFAFTWNDPGTATPAPSINTSQTGGSGFVQDIVDLAQCFGHQVTTTTASIQAAWNSTNGGDCNLAVYRSATLSLMKKNMASM